MHRILIVIIVKQRTFFWNNYRLLKKIRLQREVKFHFDMYILFYLSCIRNQSTKVLIKIICYDNRLNIIFPSVVNNRFPTQPIR